MSSLEIILLVCGIVSGLAIIWLFCRLSNKWLCVTRYDLPHDKAPEGGLDIIHLSDLHAAVFGRNNKKLIQKVAVLKPDIIVMTGDLIHLYRQRDISRALACMKELNKIAPLYVVSGNHEMRKKRWREFRQMLKEGGARVLENEVEEVCSVALCGVNCAMLKTPKVFGVSEEAENVCAGKMKILLAHKPEYIDRYAMAGYDIALCGHAHGGQWRLPFTGLGFYSPGQGLFPKYTTGVHTCGNMREVISRGLGNSECPLRLFNRPEIVLVHIARP